MILRQIASKLASAQKLCTSHLPQNSKGKSGTQFKTTNCVSFSPFFLVLTAIINVLAYLMDNSITSYNNRMAKMFALCTW